MSIDELIRDLNADPRAAETLIALLSDRMRQSQRADNIQDALHAAQVRVLANGAIVTADGSSVGHDLVGTSTFDTINFPTGTLAVNADNPRQVDVSTASINLYDYVIDPAGHGTHTTLQAAVNDALAARIGGQYSAKSFFIVSGTHAVTLPTITSSLPVLWTMVGGKTAGPPGGSQSVGVTVSFVMPSNVSALGLRLYLLNMTIRTLDLADSAGICAIDCDGDQNGGGYLAGGGRSTAATWEFVRCNLGLLSLTVGDLDIRATQSAFGAISGFIGQASFEECDIASIIGDLDYIGTHGLSIIGGSLGGPTALSIGAVATAGSSGRIVLSGVTIGGQVQLGLSQFNNLRGGAITGCQWANAGNPVILGNAAINDFIIAGNSFGNIGNPVVNSVAGTTWSRCVIGPNTPPAGVVNAPGATLITPGTSALNTDPFVTIGNPSDLPNSRAITGSPAIQVVDGGNNVMLNHLGVINAGVLPDAHHNQSHTPTDHTKEIARSYLPFGSAGVNGYSVVL